MNKDGKPDYLAINIYWDSLRSWYSPKKQYQDDGSVLKIRKLKTQGIYSRAKKLAKTHGVSKETIRKKLVKLETLGLIQRSFKHKFHSATNTYNQRIIYVLQDTPYFFNPYGIDTEEIKEITPQTNAKYIEEKHGIVFSFKTKQTKSLEIGGGIHILEDTKELRKPFSKEKDRSTKSNFLESDLEEIKKEITETNEEFKTREEKRWDKLNSLPVNKLLLQRSKPKQLKDFYPLTKEDCSVLQSRSGREFNLNAMNEILKNMSKRLTDRFFYSKKGFIAYMSKCFQYEMRDVVKVSNETFKIKANQDVSEQTKQVQEQYLTELENSLQISSEWHLKKKLASVLERNKAYNLLTSYKRLEIEQGGKCKLLLHKPVELSLFDKEIILSQIQATHERVGEDGNYISINSVEIIAPEKQSFKKFKQVPNYLELGNQEGNLGVWGRVRKVFASSYGEGGEALDSHWLSKLEVEINKEKNQIGLKAPSEFIKSYVKERLWSILSRVVKENGFELSKIEC